MITVLCPTRGRPGQAGEMVDSFLATSVLEDTRLVLVVDEDDPDVSDYLTLRPVDERFLGSVLLAPQWTGDLVRATNSAASAFCDADCILGHVGDDHGFRNEHMHPAAKKGTWDASYLASNSKEMFAHDSAAYDAWMRDRLPADVSLLQEMLP